MGDEPVFDAGLLLAGEVDPADVRRQLSRWTAAGRLYQVRRGLYALAPPFQKVRPHPFLVANRLVQGSYVSCQSALAHYGLIPEYVPVVTSVAAARPGRWETPLGSLSVSAPQTRVGVWLPAARRGRQAAGICRDTGEGFVGLGSPSTARGSGSLSARTAPARPGKARSGRAAAAGRAFWQSSNCCEPQQSWQN